MKNLIYAVFAVIFTCSLSVPSFAQENLPVVRPTRLLGQAMIQATQSDSPVQGEARVIETQEGVLIMVRVENTPPGKHAIHVHEHGSCDDAGNAAGGHFNPDGVQHGFLPSDGHAMAHAGDMGNIQVSLGGFGRLRIHLPGVSLSEGHYSIANKAIILHEKVDDFGQPTGNAGGRIGCGVIEIVESF